MSSTSTRRGSAERWGPLWGSRPDDWAATEEQQRPTYADAIRQVGLGPGDRVLEVGCGSGVFLRMAADAGAAVTGLDASEALVDRARRRVPEADVVLGDLQFLPFPDDVFDVVAGFNSFFFADDMVEALREAGRVARPGAAVLVQVWGRPERCALERTKAAVFALLPPSPEGGARVPPEYWRPGVVEELAAEAGLVPERAFDTTWAYQYADEDALVRSMLSAGGLALAAAEVGTDEVGAAIVASLAGCRTASGGYSVPNEWHSVVARA